MGDGLFVSGFLEWCCRSERGIGADAAGVALALDLTCVDPKHHRRGAGPLFLQYGVGIADELGVDVSLHSFSCYGMSMLKFCARRLSKLLEWDGFSTRSLDSRSWRMSLLRILRSRLVRRNSSFTG